MTTNSASVFPLTTVMYCSNFFVMRDRVLQQLQTSVLTSNARPQPTTSIFLLVVSAKPNENSFGTTIVAKMENQAIDVAVAWSCNPGLKCVENGSEYEILYAIAMHACKMCYTMKQRESI